MAFAEPIIVVLDPWSGACVRRGVHLKEMQPNAEST